MSKKERNKKYRESHKEETKEYKQKYNKLNKKEVAKYQKEYNKQYYKSNKIKIDKKNKTYRKENIDKVRETGRLYKKNRKSVDSLFKLSQNIKSLILGSIKSSGFKKETKTAKILGCTIQEFKEYLENQFESWMNWNNYGVYKINGKRTWQIDHLLPSASAKTEEDIIKLNHHSNLKPLCSKENLDKGNKLI